jgi:hypothetical protein
MIFVPKIKFQRDCRNAKDSDQRPRIVVSGLASGTIPIPPGNFSTDAFCDTEPLSIDVNNGCRSSGERVLTSKSPPELVKEVNVLKYVAVMNKKTIHDQAAEIAELRGLLNMNGISPPEDLSSRHDVSVHEENPERDVNNNNKPNGTSCGS